MSEGRRLKKENGVDEKKGEEGEKPRRRKTCCFQFRADFRGRLAALRGKMSGKEGRRLRDEEVGKRERRGKKKFIRGGMGTFSSTRSYRGRKRAEKKKFPLSWKKDRRRRRFDGAGRSGKEWPCLISNKGRKDLPKKESASLEKGGHAGEPYRLCLKTYRLGAHVSGKVGGERVDRSREGERIVIKRKPGESTPQIKRTGKKGDE